jgi:N-acetylmuramate 1-kinase
MPERLRQLTDWLERELRLAPCQIAPASGDASFRRYFRVRRAGGTLIAMDAPPEREDCRPYLAVAGMLRGIGLNAPQVLEADLERGFLLLTDLGSRSYLAALDESSVERLYGDALGALLAMQACGPAEAGALPRYDRRLLRAEMELFRDWYLHRHLGLAPDPQRDAVLDRAFAALEEAALEQPRVFVHRDYHSRNLMVTDAHNPGILDFQDAVLGPVTYDLVSLLRDCYIGWPRERVEEWARGYRDLALQAGVLREEHGEAFLRWFDLMGVQRHLKATGIFARLLHRDGKPGYIGDIPRTLGYAVEVSGRYPELAELHALLREIVALRGRPATAEGAQ